jgi:hypothetical protein
VVFQVPIQGRQEQMQMQPQMPKDKAEGLGVPERGVVMLPVRLAILVAHPVVVESAAVQAAIVVTVATVEVVKVEMAEMEAVAMVVGMLVEMETVVATAAEIPVAEMEAVAWEVDPSA